VSVIYETERLRVRLWDPQADAEQAFEIYRDPEVQRFIGGKPEESVETQRASLERINAKYADIGGGFGFWAIEVKEAGPVVGAMIFKPMLDHDLIEIGWHLARSAWGNGYANEAATGLVRHAFEKAEHDRLVALVDPENVKSANVARRIGMQPAGKIHAYGFDLDMYEALRAAR
jgi:[ribosomal protein S5]-alanine N-acetyltransferase